MLDWGNVPTWVGAISGALGAAGSVAAVLWAVTTTRRESRLSRQIVAEAAEERAATESARRRLHAQQVYAWFGLPSPRDTRTLAEANEVGICLGNSAAEPVYNVVAYLVWVQGAAYRTGEEAEAHASSAQSGDGPGSRIHDIRLVIQALPPGRFIVDVAGPGNSPMQGQPGVEVAFTDRAGLHWVRRAMGDIVELNVDPLEHYQVCRPVQYGQLQQLSPTTHLE